MSNTRHAAYVEDNDDVQTAIGDRFEAVKQVSLSEKPMDTDRLMVSVQRSLSRRRAVYEALAK